MIKWPEYKFCANHPDNGHWNFPDGHKDKNFLYCKYCDTFHIHNNTIDMCKKAAEQGGGLAALDEVKVYETILEARKDWENNEFHMNGESYQIGVEAKAICERFGSQKGNTLVALDEDIVKSIIFTVVNTKAGVMLLSQEKSEEIAQAIVAKFGTAPAQENASEEDIKILSRVISKKFPFLSINLEWNIARFILEEGYRKVRKE